MYHSAGKLLPQLPRLWRESIEATQRIEMEETTRRERERERGREGERERGRGRGRGREGEMEETT